MASAKAGVVGAVELEGPMVTNGSGGNKFDLGSPVTWGVIIFVAAIVYLFLM